jgi:4-oxalocrotonate tautomerase
MPHVIVKLYPGRSEEQKLKLTDAIVKDVVTIAKCEEKSVSVAFEEIEKENWAKKVYKTDILDKKDSLYKDPLDSANFRDCATPFRT